MRSLEAPDATQGHGRRWLIVAVVLALGLAGWYLATRPATPDPADDGRATSVAPRTAAPDGAETPSTGNVGPDTTERLSRNGTSRDAARAPGKSGGAATAAPSPRPAAPAPRELRVTADVDGAYVFLNRKFLGSTPLVSRDVSPGTYQLNVQTAGRPPVVRTIEIADDGPTEVAVSLAPAPEAAAAQFSASVAVVHQHGVGSCEGTLRATGDGFRYDTPHKDAFTLPFANVETFVIDYEEKRLRLKQRGGRTWNFSTRAANADPLFVFHREVDAFRKQ